MNLSDSSIIELLKKNMDLSNSLQQQILTLAEQVTGLSAAHSIVIEILMSQSPQQKQALNEGLSQILGRTELVPNAFCLNVLRNIQEVAQNPSRMTPIDRRSLIKIVPTNTDESKR